MAHTTEIKNRIKAIKDTSQIMHAMELISVAKKRSLAKKYYSNLHYFIRLRSTIKDILTFTDKQVKHEYLNKREGQRTAFIVISSDRGLVGEYNKRVCAVAHEKIKKVREAYLFTIGKTARDFFSRVGITPDVEFLNLGQTPTLEEAKVITEDILYLYDNNLLDEVKVVYTKIEGNKMKPVSIALLPLELSDFEDIEGEEGNAGTLEFAPSPQEVLGTLVPLYIIGSLYSCIVQSIYCEHHERMTTMSQAYENAVEIMARLRLDFNRARQSAITEEINEAASSATFFNN